MKLSYIFFLDTRSLIHNFEKHVFFFCYSYLADYQNAKNCYRLKNISVQALKQEDKSSDGVNQCNSTHPKGTA